MGDFEIYASLQGGGVGGFLELTRDVAAILRVDDVNFGPDMHRVRSDSAAVNVMELPESGEYVWPVFVDHPLLLDIHFLAECEAWGNTPDLALHLFRKLETLNRWELLLVHDMEEYVAANFASSDFARMEMYSRDIGAP